MKRLKISFIAFPDSNLLCEFKHNQFLYLEFPSLVLEVLRCCDLLRNCCTSFVPWKPKWNSSLFIHYILLLPKENRSIEMRNYSKISVLNCKGLLFWTNEIKDCKLWHASHLDIFKSCHQHAFCKNTYTFPIFWIICIVCDDFLGI